LVIVTPDEVTFIAAPPLCAAPFVPPPLPPLPIILPLLTTVQGMSIVKAATDMLSDHTHILDGTTNVPPELM
jgi:hypothetical protein